MAATGQQPGSRGSAAAPHDRAAAGPGTNADRWWLSESSEEESDGGSDDGGGGRRRRPAAPAAAGHHAAASVEDEEDPLYDPGADDADEAWADARRGGRPTDAHLSCPGCLATMCIDCQQHSLYRTQYRAMLTMNCEVRREEPVRSTVRRPAPPQQQRQQRGRRRKRRAPAAGGAEGLGGAGGGSAEGVQEEDEEEQQEEEVLLPVCCAVCGTQVGVQDGDEVTHFFHVIASES